MNNYCTVQIFVDCEWRDCAIVELMADQKSGWHTPTTASYFLDYATDYMDRRGAAALSYNLPVNAMYYKNTTWPAFLMDILPQGYGRKELLIQLGLNDKAEENADWELIRAGAGNPIGNLRIKEAYEWLTNNFPEQQNRGFTIEEISLRGESFIESLASFGLFIVGSSGVQGEWPKLLMTQGKDGLFYLDHTLPDDQVKKHWLVKFARGADTQYELILSQEEKFMQIAIFLNLRVHSLLELHERTLFIPRFDRVIHPDGVERIAQESIASLCSKAGFGVKITNNEACRALMSCCTHPITEILEYLKRDVANVVLGNKDNHSRNTAIHRRNDGLICLTPLFDFAPMWLHPDGIARSTKWEKGDVGGDLNWTVIFEQVRTEFNIPQKCLIELATEQLEKYRTLQDFMQSIGVDEKIMTNCQHRIENVCAQLENITHG